MGRQTPSMFHASDCCAYPAGCGLRGSTAGFSMQGAKHLGRRLHRALTPRSSKTTLGHGLSICRTPLLQGRSVSPVPRMGCEKLGPLWVYDIFCFKQHPVLLPPLTGLQKRVCLNRCHPTLALSRWDQRPSSDISLLLRWAAPQKRFFGGASYLCWLPALLGAHPPTRLLLCGCG